MFAKQLQLWPVFSGVRDRVLDKEDVRVVHRQRHPDPDHPIGEHFALHDRAVLDWAAGNPFDLNEVSNVHVNPLLTERKIIMIIVIQVESMTTLNKCKFSNSISPLDQDQQQARVRCLKRFFGRRIGWARSTCAKVVLVSSDDSGSPPRDGGKGCQGRARKDSLNQNFNFISFSILLYKLFNCFKFFYTFLLMYFYFMAA